MHPRLPLFAGDVELVLREVTGQQLLGSAPRLTTVSAVLWNCGL
jgi:hypothetical protein